MSILFQFIGVFIGLSCADVILTGIQIDELMTTVLASVLLMFMNSVVKPILKFLAFPITILTLGLFLLVINALTFWWTSMLIEGFSINGFGTAIMGALITSIITSFIIKEK